MVIILKDNNTSQLILELYESTELLGIFSEVCSVIDNDNICSFLVCIKNKPLSPLMNFAYDFTSIMPELVDLSFFLEKHTKGCFVLNFYELRKKVSISLIDALTVDIAISDFVNNNEDKVIESYSFPKLALLDNINNSILDFELALKKYFPIAFSVFVKNKYLLKQ